MAEYLIIIICNLGSIPYNTLIVFIQLVKGLRKINKEKKF